MGGADPQPPEALRHRGRRHRLRDRAEDRRTRDLAHLRGRRVRPRHHARRRPDRRGRHPEPAHDPLDPAADPRCPRGDRGEGRDLLPALRIRAAQHRTRRGRAARVRQSAERRGGHDPPAGSGAGGGAAAADLGVRDRLPAGSRSRDPQRGARVAAGEGASGSTTRSPCSTRPPRSWPAASGGSASARASTTRSTAPWSRSTTGGSGASSASSVASRATRSPGSSRR